LTPQTCLEYLNVAYRYSLQPLKNSAIELFYANKKTIIQGKPNAGHVGSIPRDVLEAMELLCIGAGN